MCGIVGLVSRRANGFYLADSQLFKEMVRADTIRGDDSTGVFGVGPEGRVDTLKGNTDGYVFSRTQEFEKFLERMRRTYRIAIGHNRKATKGAVTPANAHPFREGNIVLVHNGTLWNSKELKEEVEVDSHAIAHALNDHDAVTALGKLDGAYALVWFDVADRTLNLARNSQRPLFLAEFTEYWTIQSEIGLIGWLKGREGVKPTRYFEIPTEKILTFNLDKLADNPIARDYTEYKPPVKTYLPTPRIPHIDDWRNRRAAHNGGGSTIPLFSNAVAKRGVEAGDTVRVVFEDDKDDFGQLKFVGHPVFDGEKDGNICVEYTCTTAERETFGDDVIKYDGHFMAKVLYIRHHNRIPVLVVRDPKPIIRMQALTGETLTADEINQIVAGGCPRCKGQILQSDIESTLVQRKAGGRLRIVCPKCLVESMRNIPDNNNGEPASVH